MNYSKPKKCTYPECDRCVYVDCKWDGIAKEELLRQTRFDCEVKNELDDYSKQKRKASMNRYNHSVKGKERADRYKNTDKYKEKQKRKRDKEIATGKNAEVCRRYYYRQKEMAKDVS